VPWWPSLFLPAHDPEIGNPAGQFREGHLLDLVNALVQPIRQPVEQQAERIGF
jgi:hypothetical protein